MKQGGNNEFRKGKTLDEIYGKEKADIIRNKIRTKNLGKKRTLEQRQHYSINKKGINNPNYNPNKQKKNRYKGIENSIWKEHILLRDNFKCSICGKEKIDNINIDVHHIKFAVLYPEEQYNINNGITLCDDCHYHMHKNNQINQFNIKENKDKRIILNLGCGFKYYNSNGQNLCINIDKNNIFKNDMIVDLEHSYLPFDDNSIDIIMCEHILEHIKNLIPLMNECYRVLKTTGQLRIIVPQNQGVWGDPTHVRAFNKLSWRYFADYDFSKAYGINTHFKIIKNEFEDNEDGGQLNVILEKVE